MVTWDRLHWILHHTTVSHTLTISFTKNTHICQRSTIEIGRRGKITEFYTEIINANPHRIVICAETRQAREAFLFFKKINCNSYSFKLTWWNPRAIQWNNVGVWTASKCSFTLVNLMFTLIQIQCSYKNNFNIFQ